MIVYLLKIWPFIKSNYKLIVFLAMVALIVILWLRLGHEIYRAQEAEKGRDAAIIISNGFKYQSITYRNKFNDQVIKTMAVEVDKVNIESLSKIKDLQWLSKFDGLKKDYRNLQSAQSFGTTFEAREIVHDSIFIPYKDSIKIFDYHFKDQWNNIEAKVIGKPIIEVHDRFYAVIEVNRPKGWFWKLQWSQWQSTGEVTNSNKLIKIDSQAVIVVKRR